MALPPLAIEPPGTRWYTYVTCMVTAPQLNVIR